MWGGECLPTGQPAFRHYWCQRVNGLHYKRLISLSCTEIMTKISPVLAAVCSCAWESAAANYSWHVPVNFMPLLLAAMCFLVIIFLNQNIFV